MCKRYVFKAGSLHCADARDVRGANSMLACKQDLFETSPENKWIATLQAHNLPLSESLFFDELVDGFLGIILAVWKLADILFFTSFPRKFEQLFICEFIIL